MRRGKAQLFAQDFVGSIDCRSLCTMAMEGKFVTSAEGIIDDDVDRSIHNLTNIGKDAMCATDDMVLNIMTHKGGC